MLCWLAVLLSETKTYAKGQSQPSCRADLVMIHSTGQPSSKRSMPSISSFSEDLMAIAVSLRSGRQLHDQRWIEAFDGLSGQLADGLVTFIEDDYRHGHTHQVGQRCPDQVCAVRGIVLEHFQVRHALLQLLAFVRFVL